MPVSNDIFTEEIKGTLLSTTTCNETLTGGCDYKINVEQSTTGNIYGVYDMSGGTWEYVMGNIVSPDGETMMSGERANTSYPNDHSGYSGILYYDDTTSAGYGSYTGTYEYPENKYYDKYSFNTSSSTRGRSKLGDGIKEVYASSYGWYIDNSYLAYSNSPWFGRGGYYASASNPGVFSSVSNNGYAFTNISSRLVISQYQSTSNAVYSWNTDGVSLGATKDSISGYTTDYTTLGKNVFLKHNIGSDNTVESQEVCYILNGTMYCLTGGDEGASYETNKETLFASFGEDNCSVDSNRVKCSASGLGAGVFSDGDVGAFVDVAGCYVDENGRAYCDE